MVIISIYDSAYYLSVMIDNKIIEPKDFDSQKDTLADEIEKAYYREDNFDKWLKNKFKDKDIIICEDGGIRVIKMEVENNG